MRPALHAALRKMVDAAHGPLDRRLQQMAAGAKQSDAPAEDESALHQALEDELGVDGRPVSMEGKAKLSPEMESEEKSETVDPSAEEHGNLEREGEPNTETNQEVPKEMNHKRKHPMRF